MYRISTTAYLHTGPSISRSVHLVQAQVTFSRNRHAKCAMGEHFDTDQFAFRTFYLLFLDFFIDFMHLLQVQLTCKNHHIGKSGVKFQRFRVRDVQLGGEMHLLTDPVGIFHSRHICRNDSRYSSRLGGINNLAHQRKVFPIDYGVYRQVALYPMLLTDSHYFTQIVCSKIIGRA